MAKGNFGIIVSGGPAPGINTVIASVVFTANDNGYKTKGFMGGVGGIIREGSDSVTDLNVDSVIPIQKDGGSILGTSRVNPFDNEESKQKFISIIKENDIDKLVVIGGEGSAYLSLQLSELQNEIKVAHVPKTIDNDLILPNQHPSFGFETARYVGTQLMSTLITEAKTTNRWFVVKTMGRNAGFLALGLGIASGASVTVIPEQFDGKITPSDVADLIMPAIRKRNQKGRRYGTVILAEGIIDKFDSDVVEEISKCPRDAIGRLMFSEVNLEDLIVKALDEKTQAEGMSIKFKPENIGYVLRCEEPVPFDIEYTRFLGYGAVHFLLQGQTGFMVVRDFDKIDYVDLTSMKNEEGRIKSRQVDLDADFYKVALNFMIK